ncbi:MAG TPA: hypothetical protein VEP90_29710, partial [Methylomirabilota bacterium]|nr:hypothetical protein [Methylomirabilota bacterium]
ASIRYYVTGNNDAEVEYTIKQLNLWISGIKKNRGIPGNLIGLFVLGVLIWIIMVVCLSYEFLSLSLNFALGEIILIVLCLLLSVGYAVTYLIYSPSYNFCWGEYKNKFFDKQVSKRKSYRNNALSFAFGIICALLATYFSTIINIRPPGH